MAILHWLNDFSMLGPFLLKSIILIALIALSSLIVNKVTFSEPLDNE